MYAGHGNDFPPSKLRSRTNILVQTGRHQRKNNNKEKLTENNAATEASNSYEAGTSSEVKNSLSFQRWNVVIITREILLKYSILLFVLFPVVFLLLLEVRAFEADRFARLNFFLIESQWGSSSSSHCCFLSDKALTHYCNNCLRPVPHLLYALWCHRYR